MSVFGDMREGPGRGHAGSVTLDAIRQRDPAFDKTRFLSRAEAVLALLLRARAEGRPEQARAVVSDDMALRLRTELEGQRSAGRRQVHEGVRVRSADIAEVKASVTCLVAREAMTMPAPTPPTTRTRTVRVMIRPTVRAARATGAASKVMAEYADWVEAVSLILVSTHVDGLASLCWQ